MKTVLRKVLFRITKMKNMLIQVQTTLNQLKLN